MLSFDVLEPLVGSFFQTGSGLGAATFVLTSAELLPESYAVPNRDEPPVRLVFRCQEGTPPAQRMFTLFHESLGTVELFLVPIGMDDNTPIMECILS